MFGYPVNGSPPHAATGGINKSLIRFSLVDIIEAKYLANALFAHNALGNVTIGTAFVLTNKQAIGVKCTGVRTIWVGDKAVNLKASLWRFSNGTRIASGTAAIPQVNGAYPVAFGASYTFVGSDVGSCFLATVWDTNTPAATPTISYINNGGGFFPTSAVPFEMNDFAEYGYGEGASAGGNTYAKVFGASSGNNGGDAFPNDVTFMNPWWAMVEPSFA